MDLLAEVKSALGVRYAVEREVGRGGMAVVFLAQDRKHRRPVAVKVLRPEVAEGIGADRFLREIETAARLTHPHILPLHDSGQAGGILYYVMRTLAFSDSRTNHVHRAGETLVRAHRQSWIDARRAHRRRNLVWSALVVPFVPDDGIMTTTLAQPPHSERSTMQQPPARNQRSQSQEERSEAAGMIMGLVGQRRQLISELEDLQERKVDIVGKLAGATREQGSMYRQTIAEIDQQIASARTALRGIDDAIGARQGIASPTPALAPLPPLAPEAGR